MGRPTADDPDSPKVIVELDADTSRSAASARPIPGTPVNVRRVTPKRPRVDLGSSSGITPVPTAPRRIWIIVIAYLAAAAALALALYYRFVV